MADETVEPQLAQEDINDPHRHLAILYIVTIIVSVVAAFAFK